MFNEEDKIRWIELAPSLQDYIKQMIKENGPDYYNTHIKDVYNKISDNTNAISKEANERRRADKNLQSNIDANTANISKNKTNLDNEIKNRENAITTLKSTVDKDLSAVKNNVTKISDKIDSKEFVKVKNSADNIQIAYEQKDKEDKKNIHIYVNNTDIPITAAGGGSGLGAIPDYTKTKALTEIINYTEGVYSYTLPTDAIISGALWYPYRAGHYNGGNYSSYVDRVRKLCINDYPFPSAACTSDNGYLINGIAFARKGDVITFKNYYSYSSKIQTVPLYAKYGDCAVGIYITPLTRSITTSASGPIPDYSQKYSLHTFPEYDSGTFTTTSPGDGYLLFYSDFGGELYIDDTMVSWGGESSMSLTPVKRNAKIKAIYDNNRYDDDSYQHHTELYFVPLANGASTPSAILGLPDYTRSTTIHVDTTLTYKMPYDGCVALPANINTNEVVKQHGMRIYINGRQVSVDVQNFNLMKNDEIKINAYTPYSNFDIHIFPYR